MKLRIKKDTPRSDIKKMIERANTEQKGVDVTKFAGKLKMRKNSLDIQKDLRDEWDQ